MKLLGLSIAVVLGLLISAVPVQATSAQVELPTFPVTINGVRINNEHLTHPLMIYQNITYFPLTFYDSRFMGLGTNYTPGVGLSVWTTGLQDDYHGIAQTMHNPRTATAQVPSVPIRINGTMIDNLAEEFPLLLFRDVVYFPLTWRFVVDEFGWYSRFTPNEGLVIYSGGQDTVESRLTQLVHDAVENLMEREWLTLTFRSYSRGEDIVRGILKRYQGGHEYWTMPPLPYHEPFVHDYVGLLQLLPKNHTHTEVQWCYEQGFPRMAVFFYTGELNLRVAPNESPGELWRHIAHFDLNTRTLRSLWSAREIAVVQPDGSVNIVTPPRIFWDVIDFA